MKYFLVALLLLPSLQEAVAASPLEPGTQKCIVEQLVLQYPHFQDAEHSVGLVDSRSDGSFEMMINIRFHRGGADRVFVGALGRDYANGYLKIPGLIRNQPLDLSSCF